MYVQSFLYIQNIQYTKTAVKPFLFPPRCAVMTFPTWSLPVTSRDFRRLALSFPETSEQAHMDHPDFRVAGKIFATLGYPDESWGMVKLAPIEQEMLLSAHPTVFVAANGAWGRRGATCVRLKTVRSTTLRDALRAAWLLAAPKSLARKLKMDG